MSVVWFVIAMAALAGAGYLGYRFLALQRKQALTEGELHKYKGYARKLKAAAERLAKYANIADADDKAAEIRRTADAQLEDAKQEAANILATAKQEADVTLAAEKQQAKEFREEAKAHLDLATVQAGKIVDEADKRAVDIAGKAYDAVRNAELYEKAAKAMKNIVDGYGDSYIIPSHSLLDDLAEDFGHTEAGRNLKSARQRSKLMIQNGTAGTCDYVENNRRNTAIRFVTDAFNGKVDSILSRVRSDNSGTLGQQIRDAFTLVNHNGQAFRRARITEQYLAARLDELKWAAIAQQLKLEEREEQRQIKQQLREEAKARREYERVMRETAKEEEMLRNAMVKARQQVGEASAEQKAKYEQQLVELELKLKEAEERNRRAMSMAQQTKKGYVYIISNVGSFGGDVFKIGLTRRLEPLDRVRELGDSSVPFEFDVHALLLSDDAPALENRLHKHFILAQLNKVNYRKEFFRSSLTAIREEVEKLGIDAKWTMAAAAREYRETLAIEKAMDGSPAAREAWLARRLDLDAVGSLSGGSTDKEE